MITKELQENINAVRADARRCGLEHMTVEHLALILIKENTAVREMLVDCNADVNGLKNKLKHYVTSHVPTAKTYGDEPQPTSGFKRVVHRALTSNGKSPRQQINGLHVLAAIFTEPESYAAYYMQKYGIERLSLLARMNQVSSDSNAAGTKKSRKHDSDLVARAAAGDLELPSGRAAEIALLMRTLSCRYKNNALLVGDPGVGKTAIVHAFAHRIAAGQVPPSMRGMQITAVSVAELVAGTKYRGDFEQRIQQLIEKCRAHGNTVVFIDEIHTLIGAGAVSGGTLDGANILKPLLEEDGVRYIGITTQTEYRRIFEKDRALTRRFRKISVGEPDDTTLQIIMQQATERLTAHHSVPFDEDAAAAAVEMSRRYLPAQALPDKAIALLDEAGACRQLDPQEASIDRDEIEQLARQLAGLPPATGNAQKARLAHLHQRLSEQVLEQDEAARRLARAVVCGRLDYQDEHKVIGAFLFYGPTGVGKTEMARQLSMQMELPLLRYDMSEYMERHAVSRLIGAPPGYIGFEQSGKLIEDIVQHPAAVVLFDEVEKAHPDVLNILLQILDYGTLTDNSGRRANFNGTVIILTSNLGGGEIERGAAGFERDDMHSGDDAVRRFFTPEMRNRMDALIRFRPLSPQTVGRIVDAKLATLAKQIALKKNIRLTIAANLRRRLKDEGYSPTMGARPLQRLIKEQILEPLALADSNGDVIAGGRYRVGEDGVREASRQPRKIALPV